MVAPCGAPRPRTSPYEKRGVDSPALKGRGLRRKGTPPARPFARGDDAACPPKIRKIPQKSSTMKTNTRTKTNRNGKALLDEPPADIDALRYELARRISPVHRRPAPRLAHLQRAGLPAASVLPGAAHPVQQRAAAEARSGRPARRAHHGAGRAHAARPARAATGASGARRARGGTAMSPPARRRGRAGRGRHAGVALLAPPRFPARDGTNRRARTSI